MGFLQCSLQLWHHFLVNCQYGNWTVSNCNATCGNAVRTYTRTILPKADHGGQECTGESTITEDCLLNPCPGNT